MSLLYHGKNTAYPMPSLSPFSLHAHPPGYLGSSLRRSRQCTRLLQCGTASASGAEIQKLFPHTLPSPCSAAAILSFSVGTKRRKTRCRWQAAAQACVCCLHTSSSPGSKAHPGTRNLQLAGTAPPVKQKWSWDQNLLLRLNMWRWPHAERLPALSEG